MVLLLLLAAGIAWAGGERESDAQPRGSQRADQVTVQLDFPMGPFLPVYRRLAKEYMDLNPGVTVSVSDKDVAFYNDWLSLQMIGDTSTSIVNADMARQYWAAGKFVDLSEYLNRPNPYADGRRWRDVLETVAYPPNGPRGEVFTMNHELVQVVFFYNKEIFAEVGVEPPASWDELVEISAAIHDAGYIPFSIPGQAEYFWGQFVGWLIQIYADQYYRDLVPEAVAQPGDFNFDPLRDGTWTFDPSDPFTDLPSRVTMSRLRIVKMIMEGRIGPDSARWREMYANLAKMIPRYVPEDFFSLGIGRAGDYFVQGRAAMFLHVRTAQISMENAYFKDHPQHAFEIGTFLPPPMTGEHVGADYARTVEAPSGGFGIVSKSRAENDAAADFLMYFLSPRGFGVYYDQVEESRLSPGGIPLVRDVGIPEQFRSVLEGTRPVGQAGMNLLQEALGRGLYQDGPSIRTFQDSAQRFFLGGISLEEFSLIMQQATIEAVPRWLESEGMRPDAYLDPSRDPFRK